MKIVPLLVLIFILKLIFHSYGWEVITLSALFTSLIASTTFLIGFLITGVISDYKESEKIPGDLAASLEVIYDEACILEKNHGSKNKVVKDFLIFYQGFLKDIDNWFYRKEKTKDIIVKLQGFNNHFSDLEPLMPANFLVRMKSEQANVRRTIIRIDNIRDLPFIQSAYAIVETLGFFVIISLLVLKLEPFYESVFFTMLVSLMLIYMVMLIKDLDNPFDYSGHSNNKTEVSIKPIHDLLSRVKIRK